MCDNSERRLYSFLAALNLPPLAASEDLHAKLFGIRIGYFLLGMVFGAIAALATVFVVRSSLLGWPEFAIEGAKQCLP